MSKSKKQITRIHTTRSQTHHGAEHAQRWRLKKNSGEEQVPLSMMAADSIGPLTGDTRCQHTLYKREGEREASFAWASLRTGRDAQAPTVTIEHKRGTDLKAPALSPKIVILLGLPPNCSMLLQPRE
jgi:hypothetical protein